MATSKTRSPERNRRPARSSWDEGSVLTLRTRMLAWYRSHKRALPWRADPAPYKVWISEIMLQQTRVQVVLPYYECFLRRFPDVETLAAAEESEVLELWAGLGYYRRARNLWQAARKIMTECNGVFPCTLDEIVRLPGVGRYTAGAIYSIAFNRAEPVVDGNVRRVIGRVRGAASAPESFFWSEAESWLARRSPGDFNQALMELGALVCTPAHPSCGDCPLRPLCRSAYSNGNIVPAARSNPATESMELIVLIVRHKSNLLLVRQKETSFIPGAWAVPFRRIQRNADPFAAAATFAYSMFHKRMPLMLNGVVRHAITSRRILAHVFTVAVTARLSLRNGQFEWLKESDAPKRFTSSIFPKALAASRTRNGGCAPSNAML